LEAAAAGCPDELFIDLTDQPLVSKRYKRCRIWFDSIRLSGSDDFFLEDKVFHGP
jgi:hypothetical protein